METLQTNSKTGLSEISVNSRLANWLNMRGLDLSGEMGGEGEYFSVDAFENELMFYVSFKGSYSWNTWKTEPLFTRSEDSFRLIWNAMNETERKGFSYILGQQIGFFFIRYLGATPAQKCEAALRALNLNET